MDVNRYTTSPVSQSVIESVPGTSQSTINVSHVENQPTYDLSSFYIPMSTPIAFDNFDFNDLSYANMWAGGWREDMAALRQALKEKHENKTYRHANVGTYRQAKHYPAGNSIDHRPAKWILTGNNRLAHGTNAAVVLYSVINCNLQIVPVIKQLKLLGMEHPYIKTLSEGNYYKLCKGVRASLLSSICSFRDAQELAKAAAQNNETFFSSMPVVAFGDGIEAGRLYQNVDNQIATKRLNIRGLACRNTQEKNILLQCLKEIYDTTKNERIKEIRVCTFDVLDNTILKTDSLRRPDLAYVLASSDTIETLSHPTLNLTHIENNQANLLADYHIAKDTPISFESYDFNNDAVLLRFPPGHIRDEIETIRQGLIRQFADGNFPYKTVGEYLSHVRTPQPGTINYRPAIFDPHAENNVAHGTNLDVVTHSIINCGLQLVPGIMQQLLLGKQHEYTSKTNPELAYLLSLAVRATKLRCTSSHFHDAEEFARKAAQETTNLLSSMPVVVIGDGIDQRNMYANLDNEFAFARVNIWLLALKDETDKRIVMDWFRAVRETLGIEAINQLMFCTFDDIDNCHWENGYPVRPNLAALMAKSHTIT
ncbi:hypothetical protein [Pantoea sp. App145]|uniref:hypothetical protein n=1 Tax=Pantoea sp. App145 TaxID=3071567 RepID=UPI003A809D4B